MNKKGDLSLSVNTIVIIVLAITLLGLGLTFIQSLVGGATEELGGFIEDVDLTEKPTSSNPLVVQSEIEIKRNAEKKLNIGFYNKGASSITEVKPKLDKCITLTGEDEAADPAPELFAPKKSEVPPSEVQGYLAVLKESGLSEGRYICTLTMEGSFDGDNPAPEADFYLKVIS